MDVYYAVRGSDTSGVSDATFNAVRDRFGMQKTLEITGLVGHYLLVGQILAAFEVDLPEGVQPEIPV